MTALPILILAVLAVCGAGLVPGSALPMAVALLLAACVRPLPGHPHFRASLWLLGLLALWAAATTLPIGAAAGTWRASLWTDIQAFVAQHGTLCTGGVPPPPIARLSLHPSGTWRWLLLVLGAGGMFCLVASLRSGQRLLLAKALVVLGALVAAAGLAGRLVFRRHGFLMWWYPVAEIGGGDPLGPFVNRNHFAAFCALLLPLAIVLTLDPPARWRQRHDPDAWDDQHPGLDLALGERLLFGACLVLLLGGVLGSLSRGGMMAMLLGFLVVALLWLRRGPVAAAIAGLAALAGLVLVAVWPDAALQGRLYELRDTASALGTRWPVWLDSVRLWSRAPLLGCGPNAFGLVFPYVTTWATVQEATHAESDLLQLLAEGGLVGVLLVGATVCFCCLPLLHFLASPHRRSLPALPYPLLAGVAGGLAAIGFQSCVDIPLRIPLCAWTAAALAGLAAPPALRHRRRRSELRTASSGLGSHSPSQGAMRPESSAEPGHGAAALFSTADPGVRPSAHGTGAAELAAHSSVTSADRSVLPERLLLLALLAGALVLCWRVPGWQSLYRDRDAWLAEASTADTVALLSQTPIYWQAWYEVGQRLCRQAGSASGAERERVQAAGWDALRAAVRCRPRDPRLHANLAVSLWTAGHWTEARQHRDAQIALLPSDHAIRRQWLRAEWQAGHTDESRRLAYRFAEEAGTDPAAHEVLLWLAERELAEGSVVRAREALLVAARQRAADPALLKALARCEARLGNPDQEAEWLRRLTLTGRADAAAWWRIAELARLRRDRSALHEALGRAVQLDPSRRRAADALWKAFVQAAAPSAPPELR